MHLLLDSLPLPYHITRRHRARRAKLSVRAEGVFITIPKRMSERALTRFIEDQSTWLHVTCASYAERLTPTLPAQLNEGVQLSFFGREWPLHIVEEINRKRSHVQFDQGFYVRIPGQLKEPERSWEVKRSLKRWVQKALKQRATELCETYCEQLGKPFGRISIKSMRSRWGSCGPDGNISLNQLLAFAPEACFDYVVAHEVAHLKHPDHSPDFWACVADLMPDYKAHQYWLKHQGRYLRDIFQGADASTN